MTHPRLPRLPRLLLLTDRSQLPLRRDLVTTVGECVDAGLTHVVLRELDLTPERRAGLAAALIEVGATVIAAHHPLPGSIGTHLPATSACHRQLHTVPDGDSGQEARRTDGDIVGRSCHSRQDVAEAAREGAAYATLGPFAPTASKPGYGPPLPLTALDGHRIPVFALGGVTAGNAAELVESGAYGVAVMGAVMRAEAPKAVVRELLAVVA